jgi:hypothetical protein
MEKKREKESKRKSEKCVRERDIYLYMKINISLCSYTCMEMTL